MSRLIKIFLIVSLFLQPLTGFAANAPMPIPGTMVGLSSAINPALLKGLKVHPENPLLFDFIIDLADSKMTATDPKLKVEADKLIKYFLAALTVPYENAWVNLSPYEKDRIVPEDLGQTQMGRDMLAQDYLLKQLNASLIHPDTDLGKKFWAKVYQTASQQGQTTNIPVSTFNKVWITADQADVFVRNNAAYVVGCHLKVLVEEDYLAAKKNQGQPGDMSPKGPCPQAGCQASEATNLKASQVNHQMQNVMKEIIIPAIEREVNTGEQFAVLRQIYNAMILAAWYKKNLKEALLTQVYADRGKTSGIDIKDESQKIYQQYVQAYRKGVFNLIKEDNVSGQVTPRKYFSGGAVGVAQARVVNDPVRFTAAASSAQLVVARARTNSSAAMIQPEPNKPDPALRLAAARRAREILAGIMPGFPNSDLRADLPRKQIEAAAREAGIETIKEVMPSQFSTPARLITLPLSGIVFDPVSHLPYLKYNNPQQIGEVLFVNGDGREVIRYSKDNDGTIRAVKGQDQWVAARFSSLEVFDNAKQIAESKIKRINRAQARLRRVGEVGKGYLKYIDFELRKEFFTRLEIIDGRTGETYRFARSIDGQVIDTRTQERITNNNPVLLGEKIFIRKRGTTIRVSARYEGNFSSGTSLILFNDRSAAMVHDSPSEIRALVEKYFHDINGLSSARDTVEIMKNAQEIANAGERLGFRNVHLIERSAVDEIVALPPLILKGIIFDPYNGKPLLRYARLHPNEHPNELLFKDIEGEIRSRVVVNNLGKAETTIYKDQDHALKLAHLALDKKDKELKAEEKQLNLEAQALMNQKVYTTRLPQVTVMDIEGRQHAYVNRKRTPFTSFQVGYQNATELPIIFNKSEGDLFPSRKGLGSKKVITTAGDRFGKTEYEKFVVKKGGGQNWNIIHIKKYFPKGTKLILYNENPVSAAMNAALTPRRGGIDLNANNLKMNVDGTIDMVFNEAMATDFRNGNFSGISPEILGITRIENIWSVFNAG